MITERHNVAWRLIMKAISKGSPAGCFVHSALDEKSILFSLVNHVTLGPFGCRQDRPFGPTKPSNS